MWRLRWNVLIHLSRLGMSYECFAPDKLQTEVIDHITGDKLNETRGKISRLKDFKIGDFCALTIPGGFGAAKNLSNFGNAFSKCEVDGDVARFIMEFHAASKPIG
ncbi:unnamed protein product [Protopolystoma xenopodis]|uniref:DJ-1/PfpI domain-containing protein n=1 Tax=Protopolystoma xenopodis TaxID=117903 RepID=A0A3S5CRP2_9PLAT|nr:unnamed protein product [Protopolystoma xenopodis]VEL30895.1 unnamed protein product [Protopolystoma xenopodis]